MVIAWWHAHILVLHSWMEALMHIGLNRYHRSSMMNMRFLGSKLQISCHWRCIHSYVLIPCILIYIRSSLDRVYRFSRISSLIRIRHSLILKSIGRVERIRQVWWTYSDAFITSIWILVNHKSLAILISRVSIHSIWVSIWRWCFILIMHRWVILIKLFKV
jgi:hypothetical protein